MLIIAIFIDPWLVATTMKRVGAADEHRIGLSNNWSLHASSVIQWYKLISRSTWRQRNHPF